MDERTREIRQVLLGRCRRLEDGSLSVIPAEERWQLGSFQGVSTGWGAIHFLGLSHRERSCPLQAGMPKDCLEDAMKTLGRAVYLEPSQEFSACLCNNWLTTPVLLMASRDGNRVEMSAYTARGALAPLRCRRALRMLERRLLGTVEKRGQKSTGKKSRKGFEKRHGRREARPSSPEKR